MNGTGKRFIPFRRQCEAVINLLFRGIRTDFGKVNPVFVSLTWHAGHWLMLYKVGINTQQHFGITDTGRLHHIHLTDVVAAHRIHDGPLKGQCFPAPFLVCGFFREIVIGIRPFNGGLWLRPEQ